MSREVIQTYLETNGLDQEKVKQFGDMYEQEVSKAIKEQLPGAVNDAVKNLNNNEHAAQSNISDLARQANITNK